jgi:hypothetical protein
MICNLSEAALHLGYRSRSTLQRLVRDGHLEAYRVPSSTRQVLLELDPPGRPSLRSAVQALTQIRYDSPLWSQERQRAEPVELEPLSDEQLAGVCDEHFNDEVLEAGMAMITAWCNAQRSPDWNQVAEVANSYLDQTCWAAPPWSAEQWNTLAMVLALAQEDAGL